MVGQDGISLLEKVRNNKFDIIVAHQWGQVNAAALIRNLISRISPTEIFDVMLDDNVTCISYFDPAVINSGLSVTEDSGRISVHFFNILKNHACRLDSEKSDLEELVQVFSPFFTRIRRFILRSPTPDFRYIVSVDTATVIKNPDSWFSEIRASLSAVLINRPTIGINFSDIHAAQSLQSTLQVGTPLFSGATSSISDDMAVAYSSPIAADIVHPPVISAADLSIQLGGGDGKLTLIFAANDDPMVALLAAGVVWSLPPQNGQKKPITVTEIGAYRKKLISPFRKLVGVTAHQETDVLPMTTARLERLIQDISAQAKQHGDHVLFFGYEILSFDLLDQINRFLQNTDLKYQIIVCTDSLEQMPQMMGIETAFNALAPKSWVYLDHAEISQVDLNGWKTNRIPRLDDIILKKVVQGDFRIVEKLNSPKAHLSILQMGAFEHWLAHFRARITGS